MVVCHIVTKEGQSAFTRFFITHVGAVTKDTIIGWEQICEKFGGYQKAVVFNWQELYGTGHMETSECGGV